MLWSCRGINSMEKLRALTLPLQQNKHTLLKNIDLLAIFNLENVPVISLPGCAYELWNRLLQSCFRTQSTAPLLQKLCFHNSIKKWIETETWLKFKCVFFFCAVASAQRWCFTPWAPCRLCLWRRGWSERGCPGWLWSGGVPRAVRARSS